MPDDRREREQEQHAEHEGRLVTALAAPARDPERAQQARAERVRRIRRRIARDPDQVRVGHCRVAAVALDVGEHGEQMRIARKAVESDQRPAGGDDGARGREAQRRRAPAPRGHEPDDERQRDQLERDDPAERDPGPAGAVAPAPAGREAQDDEEVDRSQQHRAHGCRGEQRGSVDAPVAHAHEAQREPARGEHATTQSHSATAWGSKLNGTPTAARAPDRRRTRRR